MTTNVETTMATACPSFITETTSQEEGVFVGMDFTVLNDSAMAENDVSNKSPSKSDSIDGDIASGAHARHNDSGCQAKLSTTDNSSRKKERTTTDNIRGKGDNQPNRSMALTAPSSGDNDDVPRESTGSYTTAPDVKVDGLSFFQTLREYRHAPCFMTPLSTLVLLAVLCSSLVSLLFFIPQFMIGLLLGPLVRRQFWLVEFLYRWDVVGWGLSVVYL